MTSYRFSLTTVNTPARSAAVGALLGAWLVALGLFVAWVAR
jgi:hypothetical protein